MAAREIKIWSGTFEQDLPDDYLEATMQTHVGNRRAVQIYNVNFNLHGAEFIGQATDGSVEMVLWARNRHGVITKELLRWSTAIITIGAVVGVGVVQLDKEWVAPQTLILADYEVVVSLETTNITAPQTAHFQVYYKAVVITDVQEVQLQLL